MNSNNNGNNNGKGSNDMVRLGGLWKNETKDGKSYLSGTFGGARVLIFPNGYKKDGSNDPDFILNLAPNQPKEGKPQQQQRSDAFDLS